METKKYPYIIVGRLGGVGIKNFSIKIKNKQKLILLAQKFLEKIKIHKGLLVLSSSEKILIYKK